MAKTLSEIQKEISEWSLRNFGKDLPIWKFVGVVEELGELAHTELKRKQGIRTTEDHDAKGKDAVGDIMVYLLDYCSRRGWDAGEILNQVWSEVKKRDWKKDPEKGGTS